MNPKCYPDTQQSALRLSGTTWLPPRTTFVPPKRTAARAFMIPKAFVLPGAQDLPDHGSGTARRYGPGRRAGTPIRPRPPRWHTHPAAATAAQMCWECF